MVGFARCSRCNHALANVHVEAVPAIGALPAGSNILVIACPSCRVALGTWMIGPAPTGARSLFHGASVAKTHPHRRQPVGATHFMTPEGLIWTPPRLALPVAGEATLASASRAGTHETCATVDLAKLPPDGRRIVETPYPSLRQPADWDRRGVRETQPERIRPTTISTFSNFSGRILESSLGGL
jgi:hypothetical protein